MVLPDKIMADKCKIFFVLFCFFYFLEKKCAEDLILKKKNFHGKKY